MKKAISPPKKHLIYILFIVFGVLTSFKGSAQLTIPSVIINSCSGSITVSADGGVQPYAYTWFKNNGATWDLLPNEDYFVLSGQTSGNYRVVVTDASGAEVTGEYAISEPYALYIKEIVTGLVCAEDPDSGVVILRFENGIPPYNWTLTGSSSSFTTRAGTVTPTGTPYFLSLENIPVGDYTFSWTDDFGCSGTEEITVSAPPITALTVNTTTDVICFGDSNGAVNVSVTGGWGANYAINIVPDGQAPQAIGSWTDIGDGTNHTINNLPAGTYQIYYYDKLANSPFTTTYGLDVSSYSCSKFETFTIGTPAELISTPTGELLSCFGDTDGNITGTITGGTAPYTITLNETGTQFTGITDGGAFDFSGLGAGTYNFTITDAVSCSVVAQASITQPAELTTGFVSKQDVSCNAGTDGNIVVSVTGGTAPYIFELDGVTVTPTSSSGNNFTIGNLSAGSYSITVTDQNNCIATTTIIQTITEPTALAVTISGEALTCFGDSDGNIIGTVSGGTAPYTITLVESGTQFTGITDGGSFDFSGLSAGTYNFTITDNAGCTSAVQESIIQPNEIQVSSVGSLLSCFGDTDGNITGTITGGTAPYAITLVETGTQSIGIADGGAFDFSGLGAGTYNFTITDAANCSVVVQELITQPDVLTTSFVSKQNASCNAGTDGNIIVSVTGGTAPYIFKVAGVIVTPTLISGTNYTIGNLEASSHTITITDQSSCADSITQVITQPDEINLSLLSFQNLSCFNTGNGAITVGVTGGTPNYIFTLTGPSTATAQDNGNGTWTFASLDAGTYTISVTDQNNCTSNPTQISQELTQPIEIDFTTLPQDISCFGLTDGTITIPNYTTDYNYEIAINSFPYAPITTFSVQGTDLVYTDLAVDSYRIKVWFPGNNGATCAMFRFIDINEPTELILTSSSVSSFNAGTGSPVNISCNGASDGSVDVTMSGGIGPYSYIWTTVDGSIPTGTENDEDISGLTAGTYSVQVSDQNSCQKSFDFTLVAPRVLNNTAITTQDNVCFNGESGALISQITTSGSVDGIIYTYTVVGNPALPSSYPAVQTTTNLTATFSNLPAGDYQVQVSDQNGCTSTSSSVAIAQPASLLEITSANISAFNSYGIRCNGFNDGSIDITVSGGVGIYTYLWTGPNSFTATTQNISSLAPGVYSLTVTDANGCTDTETYTITEPAALGLTGVLSDYNGFGASGNGLSDGSIDITVTGGVTAYTYSWTTVDGTIPVGQEVQEDLTGLTAGTYTVLITDKNVCTITATWTITEPQELLITEQLGSHVNVLCFGESTGVIEVSVTQGSVSPYDYTITNSSGTVVEQVTDQTALNYVFDALFADTYSVTVTDANGISKTITNIIITQPTAILNIDSGTLSSHNGFNISCNGSDDGSIDVTISGGATPYTYSWTGTNSFTATTQNISSLAPGVYSLTVTDANGCTDTETYTITEPAALGLTGVLSDYNGFGVSGNGLSDGDINSTVTGGTSTYTYAWTTVGGTIPAGQTTTADLTGLNAGTYTVVVTDANGCTITETWTITEPQELLITEQLGSHVNVLCFGESTGVIEVSVTQGSVTPYDYTITNSSGTVVEQVTDQTALNYVFDALFADTYSVTVTDANGISKTITNIIITQPVSLLEITDATLSDFNGFNISCNGSDDGSIDITVNGGTGAYTYSWTGPNSFTAATQDISSLAPGDYTITVTDANTCTFIKTYTIVEPGEIIINTSLLQNVQCFENNDGKILIEITGGTGDFEYTWTKDGAPYATTKDLVGIGPGEYMLLVKDLQNTSCFRTKTFMITEPDLLEIAFESKTDILCYGDTTGSVQVSVTGGTLPYQYSWTESGGATYNTEDLSGVPAGNYQLTLTDANGCTDTLTVILNEPNNLVLNESKTDVTCYGSNNGTISLNVTGGVSPYTYVWNDLGNGPLRSDLSPGVYDVTVTDSNNCQKSVQIEILEAPVFKIDPITTNISCFGEVDGSIDLNLIGGIAPLSITWADDSSAGLNRNNLSAGTYSVLIEDASGCTITETFSIIEPNEIVLDAVVVNAIDCSNPDSGSVDLQIIGGTPPFTFLWSNGATSEDLQDVGANNYTVTVTDSRGCQEQKTVVVTRQAPLVLSLSTNIIPDCTNKTVAQRNELEVVGGVAPYVISWSNGTVSGVNGEIMETTQNGTVIVEVTDSLGCTEQMVFDINLFTLGNPSFNYDSFANTNYEILSINDPITFNNTSTGDALSYLWSFGDGNTSTDENPIHTYVNEGTYEATLTVQYSYGCSYVATMTLNVGKGYEIVIPNAFTPNGDGVNDVIRPVFIGMTDVEMSIYNTWGALIYFEKGLKLKGWNGAIENNLSENGNYIIRVKATTFYGLVLNFNSPITLIK